MIEFEWDSRALGFFRDNAGEKALSRALRLAGNAALKVMASESESHVVGRKLIDRARVRGGLDLVFPGSKEAISSLVWTERVSGEAMPLAHFPFIATGQGVRVRVNTSGGWGVLPHAFAARMKNGHLGVFQRKGKERKPIREMWTTKISDAMSDEGAVETVQGRAMGMFTDTFDRGLERELAKLRRKGDA
jgi:hypothetical protein